MANGEKPLEELPDASEKLQLNAYEMLIATRFQRFFRNALLAIAIIGITSGVAVAGLGYMFIERNQALITVCKNGNERHDNTINALVAGSNTDQQNAETEAAKMEIRRRRDVTISLIDAIAPKLDCDDPEQPAVKTKLPE